MTRYSKSVLESISVDFNQIPIVFVQGVGRCGFDLLRTLLDGHDEILILPFTDKFNIIWSSNKFSEQSNIDELVQAFLYRSKMSRLKGDEYSHSFREISHDFSKVNWDRLEANFRKYLAEQGVSSRNTRLAIFFAFGKAINQNLDQLKVLVADAFYADFTTEILKDFPNARFLHIFRDHRGNISSLKNYYLSSNQTLYPISGNINYFTHILANMLIIMKMLHRNQEHLGNQLKLLKYEDLLTDPEKTLKDLSNWLGIYYSNVLLKTTRLGLPAKSDSAFQTDAVQGINPSFATRWRTQMTSYEIRMIEFLFGGSLKHLGYEKMYADNLKNKCLGIVACLLPWKGEIFSVNTLAKKTIGRNRFAIWRYLKFGVYTGYNLPTHIKSRITLLYMIWKGEFKSMQIHKLNDSERTD